MSDDQDRRSVLESIGIGLFAAGVPGVAAATRDSDGSSESVVPKAEAREAARAQVREAAQRSEFADWADAEVGSGRTFVLQNAEEGPRHQPSAYVFTVENGGEALGYVTAAAQYEWAPILEFSRATPPTALVDQTNAAARERGHSPTGNLLYHGGVKYGVELAGGEVMNVRNGRVEPVSAISPSEKSFDEEFAEERRNALVSGGAVNGAAGIGAGGSAAASSAAMDYSNKVRGVPAWTEHDDGGWYETYMGCGVDEWDEWDGCSPIAGSMVIGYHEYVDEDEDCERELLIDRLHIYMKTDDSGDTYPWNIDDGFDKYDDGWYDYNGRNIYSNATRDYMKQEIDYNRPFLCNMDDAGSAWDNSQDYNDHSVTVVGYDYDGDVMIIHDTWDDETHYLTWGNWSNHNYTKVWT